MALLRILVAHEAIDSAGGAESYLSAIIPALTARGHEVAVLYDHRSGSGPTDFAPPGVLTLGVDDLGIDGAIERVRAWRPDVCFSHNMRPLEVDRRLLAEWPVVKMMHSYSGTCASGLKMHAFPSAQPCDRSFGPACLVLYGPRRCGQLRLSSLVRGYRWASHQHALLTEYAAIVVASGHMAREFAREGVASERLHVIPLFAPAAPRATEGGDAVVFIGRMTPLKGVTVLVRAMAEAGRRLGREVPLVLAGEGPDREAARRLAQSLGVAAEFTGWIEPERRAALLERAALVVIPSQWPEPFGLAGLEAAAYGVPAVAFDVGGICEWLRDDVNGRLVPLSQGAEGLGETIAALLSRPAEWQRLSEGATRVAAELSQEAHVERLEHVLNSVTSS
jgi:glycosyltransferase involved in cell wall biosynthesis